jgi:hypothetical protein
MHKRHKNKEQTENNDDMHFVVDKSELTIDEIREYQDKELHKISIFEYFAEYLYNFTQRGGVIIYDAILYIINISGIYLIWVLLHYVASHLYITFCVPKTIYGFIMSPFMIPAPHCQGLRWIVYNGSNIITNMWVVLGTWLCSVLVMNKDKK